MNVPCFRMIFKFVLYENSQSQNRSLPFHRIQPFRLEITGWSKCLCCCWSASNSTGLNWLAQILKPCHFPEYTLSTLNYKNFLYRLEQSGSFLPANVFAVVGQRLIVIIMTRNLNPAISQNTIFTIKNYRLEQSGSFLPANVTAAVGQRLLLLDFAEEDLKTTHLQQEHAALPSQVRLVAIYFRRVFCFREIARSFVAKFFFWSFLNWFSTEACSISRSSLNYDP